MNTIKCEWVNCPKDATYLFTGPDKRNKYLCDEHVGHVCVLRVRKLTGEEKYVQRRTEP